MPATATAARFGFCLSARERIAVVERHQRIALHTPKSPHLPIPQKQGEEQHGKGDAEQRGQEQYFHGWRKRTGQDETTGCLGEDIANLAIAHLLRLACLVPVCALLGRITPSGLARLRIFRCNRVASAITPCYYGKPWLPPPTAFRA